MMDRLTPKRRIVFPEDLELYSPKGTALSRWRRSAKKGYRDCPKCGHIRPMTIDHIVPLAILKSFAISDVDMHFLKYEFELNFQELCFECNLSKGERLDFSDERTLKIFDALTAFHRGNPRTGRSMDFMEAQTLVNYTYKNLIN